MYLKFLELLFYGTAYFKQQRIIQKFHCPSVFISLLILFSQIWVISQTTYVILLFFTAQYI